MPRWKTLDVAEFAHDPNPNSTIIGTVRCLLCSWTKEPTSQFIFPTIDDAVEGHIKAAHPERINEAGIQRAPIDEKLVYYIVTNPKD